MEGILKVTPEHLLQTSGEFNNIGGQIIEQTLGNILQGIDFGN